MDGTTQLALALSRGAKIMKAMSHKVPGVRVDRPQSRMTNPLVNTLVHTGEPDNPWRCQTCATRAQHENSTDFDTSVLKRMNIEFPVLCRKCGLDFA